MLLEHAFLNLVDFVLWSDGLFQKKIQKGIPDLEDLLTHPQEVLTRRELTIGPNRRYGTAFFMGFCLTALCWFAICLGAVDLGGQIAGATRLAFLCILLAIPILAVFVTLRLYRGGECVLTQTGVELRYRRKVVFCPWSLFAAVGSPRVRNGVQAVLPINVSLIPSIEMWRWEKIPEHGVLRQPGHEVIASGHAVRSRQFRFAKSGREVVLVDLYEVRLAELADLILRLAMVLGSPQNPTRES